MTIDRIKGPAIHAIGENLQFPQYQLTQLTNALPLAYYSVQNSTIVQLTFTFQAGLWNHPKKLVSSLTNRLLREGTQLHSATEIAEWFEYHGASLNTSHDSDYASVSLYCLRKHLSALLPWLAEVIQSPAYNEAELALQIKLGKESLKQEAEKTEFIAGQQFGKSLFGEQHPYGRSNSLADYDAVTCQDLREYHASHYHAGNAKLFAYGAVDSEILQQLEFFFGQENWPAKAKPIIPTYSIMPEAQLLQYIEKEKAVQTSIRIGAECIAPEHPDYQAYKITCIVLGGYFGSRLMSSVREEKGYTYGIHAGIVNRLYSNYFRISTEVGKHVREDAVATILEEIKILQSELMEQDELDGVRNYLLGNYVDQQSNFFQTSSLINHYFVYNKTEDDYNHALAVLRNIQVETIQEMAQKHFAVDKLYQVLAG